MPTTSAPTARPTLTVEIWSDLICPWCWIGKRRFDEALAAFAHADHVDVVLRAYRLMPGQPVEPVEAMLAHRYRMSAAQVAQMLNQATDAAASVGLHYDLPGTLVGDTLDGHRLVKLAQTTGRAHALTERLYRAYFSEHGSLFDRAALTGFALEAGLERSAVEAVLSSDAYRDDVEADIAQAERIGGRGVPLFVFGGRYAVSGAQPADVFAQALDRAWRDGGIVDIAGSDAAACGPDGCELPTHRPGN
ncbi:DsbA family oxidoreductase [Burkholderia dolosa]|uniref:DsbA family oxidoreductase n=1 Tax=Burkholderia dolosa TaxID=152500 RepID=UPI0015925CD2|nr:DsbA family oxidoreductase [Burkholderia dolosa]